MKNFIQNHPELSTVLLIGIACYLFLFFGLDFYPLLDVDESRYGLMARNLVNSDNWNLLMLNGIPFTEKPPLYFWLTGLSIKTFGFGGFAVRFPCAILATLTTFATYYVGKAMISRKFGIYSALILVSGLFFLMLSHVAILDMVFTALLTASIFCGLLTHFCQDKNKKFYWFGFYLFIALGFLAKGLLALVIPVAIIFIYNLITKTIKDIFKPINILPGIVLFLLMVLPWHIVMYKTYGYQFIYDYFILHHFSRFVSAVSLGRDRAWWFFIPVFIAGFMPWSLNFIAGIVSAIKNRTKFDFATKEGKFLLYTALSFVVIFGLFSIAKGKLPTYILPAFPFAALLTAYFWVKEDFKPIAITTYILGSIFFLAGIAGLISTPYVSELYPSVIQTSFGLLFSGLLMLATVKVQNVNKIFAAYLVTMLFITYTATTSIFQVMYDGGQNELVRYSKFANEAKVKLVAFDMPVKPSILIDYDEIVTFIDSEDFVALDKELSGTKKTVVILKNKHMKPYKPKVEKRLELMHEGQKYSLYKAK